MDVKLGHKFGFLTVIGFTKRGSFLCRCVCGKELRVQKHSVCVKLRPVKSCGCRGIGYQATYHGMKNSQVYRTWCYMKNRCLVPTNRAYPKYGGRGITICERWQRFENFYADMGDQPAGMSIDRIDNDRGYEPGNCRWATRIEQQNNRSVTVFVKINGETLSRSDAARKFGIPPSIVRDRMRGGWTAEEALGLKERER